MTRAETNVIVVGGCVALALGWVLFAPAPRPEPTLKERYAFVDECVARLPRVEGFALSAFDNAGRSADVDDCVDELLASWHDEHPARSNLDKLLGR